jgi:predicted acetyltransferase
MRLKEREVRDVFFSKGAISPATAASFGDLGLDETMAVARLKRRAVVRESAPGLFYFDDGVWQAMRNTRRRIAVVFLLGFIFVGLLLAYGSVGIK